MCSRVLARLVLGIIGTDGTAAAARLAKSSCSTSSPTRFSSSWTLARRMVFSSRSSRLVPRLSTNALSRASISALCFSFKTSIWAARTFALLAEVGVEAETETAVVLAAVTGLPPRTEASSESVILRVDSDSRSRSRSRSRSLSRRSPHDALPLCDFPESERTTPAPVPRDPEDKGDIAPSLNSRSVLVRGVGKRIRDSPPPPPPIMRVMFMFMFEEAEEEKG